MSDQSVSGVGKVSMENQATSPAFVYGPNAMGNAAKPSGVKSTPPVQSKEPEAKAKAPVQGMSDVRLQFRVDEQTNEVTVMVVDRASRKVIRTIPPEELKNLREGELVQYYT